MVANLGKMACCGARISRKKQMTAMTIDSCYNNLYIQVERCNLIIDTEKDLRLLSDGGRPTLIKLQSSEGAPAKHFNFYLPVPHFGILDLSYLRQIPTQRPS